MKIWVDLAYLKEIWIGIQKGRDSTYCQSEYFS